MGKIKNIFIKIELKGQGIVNYDSNDQKYILGDTHLKNVKRTSNVSYSKKAFEVDENTNEKKYKIKISSDSLKRNMFSDELIAETPNIIHHPVLYYSFIASPLCLSRGYLYLDGDKINDKRKSSLTLCDAIQSNNGLSFIETFSRSGTKKTKIDDKSDTSFFSKETIGKISYESDGNINMDNLQFVSVDAIFDRQAFNPDYFDLYKQILKQKLPIDNPELNYYLKKNSTNEIPEYGLLLNEESIVFLIKYILKKILGLSIKKSSAYAETTSLKIKLVENPIDDKLYDPNNWIDINNKNDIDMLEFEPYMFYEEIDNDLAKKQRDEIKNNL